ncbi:MAG: MFS transporter [Alphaproteobacteria bacterium CG_4_10_14_0_8_um_filter_37_21]|nr:MAG: MFS transporter [Alphaproteobacteria bacterium CG_4_10_14_0_8_um_filter_37_21]
MTKRTSLAWVIWATAAFFYFYEMLLRVSPGVMTQELMETFYVSSTSLGLLSSFYYYSYNVLQLPCGIIIDRIGPRAIVTASCFLCAMGAGLFYSTDSLAVAKAARFIMGMGSACAFISTLKLTAAWFPVSQFAIVTGFTVMLGKLGGASQAIMSPVVSNYGWRTLYLSLFVIGIIATIMCFLFIKNKPDGKITKEKESPTTAADILRVMKNKQVWCIGFVGGLMYIPITGFGELWSVPFLTRVCDINNAMASKITGLLYLGFSIGSPLFAALTKKIKSHVKVMIISCTSALIIFSIICYAAQLLPLYLVATLYCLGGASIAGQVLTFTVAKENTSIALSGTTVGFTNMLVMLSAIICQPLIGWVLDKNWTGLLSETGIRIYDKSAYQIASLSIPVGMLMCLLLLYFVKETYKE